MCTVSETIIIKSQAKFCESSECETLQANGSAGVSQILDFGYRSRESSYWIRKERKKREKERERERERERVLLMIEMKPTCTVNFFNDSIQVARKTRIQIVIYLFVDVFLFL